VTSSSGQQERTTGVEPVVLSYLGRRALRFWRSAAVSFAVMAALAAFLGYRAWQPYRSQAVLMFDQPVSSGEDSPAAFDAGDAGARLRELFFAGDRLAVQVARHHLFPELTTAAAVDELRKRLSFEVKPGGTFVLSFVGFSAVQAQSLLRELSAGVIDAHHQQRRRAAILGRQLHTTERITLEKQVAALQADLTRFLAQHPDAGMLVPPAGSEAQLLLLEQQLVRLRRAAAARGAGGDSGGPSIVALGEQAQAAQAALAKARQDLDDVLSRFTERHPDVFLARRRLAGAQSDLDKARAALAKLAPSDQGALDGPTGVAIAELEAQINQLRAAERAARNLDPRKRQLAVQLEGLREGLQNGRNRLSVVRDQELRAEAIERMEKSESLPRLSAVDLGSLPGGPLQSRRRRIALGGTLLAATLAMTLALARAVLSDRLFDPTDIAHLAGAGVLAVVPAVPGRHR
jgi:polysaccharide biosynthesis transport protein